MLHERSLLCLFNWDLSDSVVDDGSYINWLEGTRVLDAAIEVLPFGVSWIGTEPRDILCESAEMSPAGTLALVRETRVTRALIAGNYIERDVIPFALTLVRQGVHPIILFDVCGTLDPMAKWRSLANAVDQGIDVSTVQQTLRMLLGETPDLDLRARITRVMHDSLGEHAEELTAA